MGSTKDLIFKSSGWKCDDNLLTKARNIIISMKEKRKNKEIPLFSILDNDTDIKKIINDSKFFIDNKTIITDFVLIGTGGSSLGATTLIKSNVNEKTKIQFHVLDSLDPLTIKKTLDKLTPQTSKFLVISKSGKTTEIIALMMIVIDWLNNSKVKISENVMCMYDYGMAMESPVAKISREYGLNNTSHPNIGGRFSALTATGLLPATVMGIDPYLLRNKSQEAINRYLNVDNQFILNSSLFSSKGINKNKLNCVIHYGDNLSPFLFWYRQLWNESLGKKGEGTFLLTAKGSIDQHSQLQMWLDGPNNGLFTFLNLRNTKFDTDVPFNKKLSPISKISSFELLNVMSKSTYQALADKSRPVRSISVNDLSVESTVSLMIVFIIEVLLVAELLKINPYDQDAVEDIKINTLRNLKKYE